MAKAKKSAAKTARKGKSKSKTKVSRPATRAAAPKPKTGPRRTAAKPKPVQGIAAKLGNAVNVVVETIKETAEMRRKMHADQPEE